MVENSDDYREPTEDWGELKRDMKRLATEQMREARDQLREQVRSERRQRRERGRGKDNVVACRLDNEALEALDTMVEAGVRSTRADAAAWLIGVGLEAHRELLDDLSHTVSEIRRLRQDAASKAQRFAEPDPEARAEPTDNQPTDRLPD